MVKAYSELFERMDLDGDGFLNKSELDQYMMRTEGAPVQDTAFQWLKHKFESKEGKHYCYFTITTATTNIYIY